MKPNLQQYFKQCQEQCIFDHHIRVTDNIDNVVFYIHPQDSNGETLDFKVTGNELEQLYIGQNISSALTTITELELVMNVAIEDESYIGLFVEMPGFDKPELIINHYENLPKKLEYYKRTYDYNLEHKQAKGIKIIGYTF